MELERGKHTQNVRPSSAERKRLKRQKGSLGQIAPNGINPSTYTTKCVVRRVVRSLLLATTVRKKRKALPVNRVG